MRSFGIYRGRWLVLMVEDRPGLLLSNAAPPPEGAPGHPFVSLRSTDPFAWSQLEPILDAATSFDDFLARLISQGFDVAARTDFQVADAQRIVDGDQVLGCVWDSPGPIATLEQPPAAGWTESPFVTLTAYPSPRSQQLLELARAAEGVEGFLRSIWAEGLEFRAVADD
jgi:hypothetical protein